ncbi:MAPEG family protein [Rhodobacterales bacterium HKCCE3408]|nr:MAPEG family protein [Rhodobacterales bacterium HKCCE3408]
MSKRGTILLGMGAGAVWAVLVPVIGRAIPLPIGFVQPALLGAAFPPGLVLLAVIGRLAQRRFFDDGLIDGAAPASGSAAEIDQRVLTNTVEQVVLALAIWPFAGLTLGPGVVLVLGLGFAVARVLFWIGYHLSPPLRAFGFAATFYPTVVVAAVTLWLYFT